MLSFMSVIVAALNMLLSCAFLWAGAWAVIEVIVCLTCTLKLDFIRGPVTRLIMAQIRTTHKENLIQQW